MNVAINRFVQRLHLSKNLQSILDFKIITFREFKHKHSSNALQLFHSIKTSDKNELQNIIESITKIGFKASEHGNKGNGIYFTNHSRYSLFMEGHNVMICDIIPDEQHIKRFRSEIIHGSTTINSEYLILNPQIIIPRYFIEYTCCNTILHNLVRANDSSCYVRNGNFGCKKCDELKKKCNCLQDPIINEYDLI